jgi:hypothetical protein
MAGQDAGHPVAYDTLAEFQFLKSLEASRNPITLIMGEQSDVVVVDKVALTPERWTQGNAWFEGIVTVRLLTLKWQEF